jgi:hypothetical protein
MFEKLIVAFDGSDTEWDGLVLSMGPAKASGSHVRVVYVYDKELAASSTQAGRETGGARRRGAPPGRAKG